MKLKYSLIFSIIIVSAAIAFAEGVEYPVAELGNCKDQADCKVYCDKPENAEICVNFAEKNNLMSEEEIQLARNFIATGSSGPGGCTSKDSCEQYCNDINHIDECISFAEKNNLMSGAELEEAKKVQAAIVRGVKPPPCGNKKSCDAYCESSEHMEECITFGEAAGFIQGKELEDAKKMLTAIKRGVKAPPCKGKEACDQYCNQPENMELCMNFAMEAGFMSEEEKADVQKMLQALKQGVRPPNCRGKEECDKYCSEETHFEECINFSVAAGFMKAEEAEMARKTGGKGPGGCKGKEECEAFCNNPDNQQTCFDFGKEHGMISEEDLKKMEEGTQQFRQSLEQAPQAVIDCLNSEIGSNVIEKLKSGSMPPSQDIGEKMRKCFETVMPMQSPGGPGEGGSMPPGEGGGGQTGPGGCASPEECQNYCTSNPQECQNFQPPTGSEIPPGMGMPGDYQQPAPAGALEQPMMEPGAPIQGGEIPPPSTMPGSGGEIQPGVFVPPIEQAPLIEQQPPPPPPEPAPEPTGFLESNPLLGAIIQNFLNFFSPQK